ncbi:hypothetical protein PVAP13_3NG055890 [Panicum virgatum]|uniref:Uncharacterized protein n=1 Tax=Panicum virgatum TaxID=38727 RepID=A0A8T0U5C5_PANVG|nr:hypothetical protein PVAP13_3NG055890 [Panicum virgatum]
MYVSSVETLTHQNDAKDKIELQHQMTSTQSLCQMKSFFMRIGICIIPFSIPAIFNIFTYQGQTLEVEGQKKNRSSELPVAIHVIMDDKKLECNFAQSILCSRK